MLYAKGAWSTIRPPESLPSYAKQKMCSTTWALRIDKVSRPIFLGTGDSLNGERAQASLAIPLPSDETMLIDASSGTVLLGRLETAGISLESVRHLFLSHRHFDHVGGLAPLLATLASLPEASLTVHAAPQTLQALRDL